MLILIAKKYNTYNYVMYIDHIKQYWKNTLVEKQQIALNKIKGNST